MSHHVLARLYPGVLGHVQRRGDTVVVAAVHGEHHVLGLRMVADVFEGAGFDVRFLGADVPEGSLAAWVSEHRPASVRSGVTMPLGAATLARQLQALRDSDPELRLIIGGQGVPDVLRESAGVLYAADTEQLAEQLTAAECPQPGSCPRYLREVACGSVCSLASRLSSPRGGGAAVADDRGGGGLGTRPGASRVRARAACV